MHPAADSCCLTQAKLSEISVGLVPCSTGVFRDDGYAHPAARYYRPVEPRAPGASAFDTDLPQLLTGICAGRGGHSLVRGEPGRRGRGGVVRVASVPDERAESVWDLGGLTCKTYLFPMYSYVY